MCMYDNALDMLFEKFLLNNHSQVVIVVVVVVVNGGIRVSDDVLFLFTLIINIQTFSFHSHK